MRSRGTDESFAARQAELKVLSVLAALWLKDAKSVNICMAANRQPETMNPKPAMAEVVLYLSRH